MSSAVAPASIQATALRPVAKPGILDIHPYVPGESKAESGRVIRLAANEGALGTSPKVAEAFRTLADSLHRYPDGGAVALRQALGKLHGIDPDRLICGDGSDELIANIARAFCGVGDEIVYSNHGFLMYPLAGLACGATLVKAPEIDLRTDVDAILALVNDKTKIVFIANPNNPTGSFLTGEELRRLHAGLPGDTLLVIDAAYAEYAEDVPGYESGIGLVGDADNVMMTRTFSKIYGLGGLRVGWGYGSSHLVDVLNRVRAPFNVSSAAQTAALAALADTEFLARSRAHNHEWRDWTKTAIEGLGLTVYPSVGNFLLVEFGGTSNERANSARLALKDDGILVRQMESYGLPSCLRISIGTGEEMKETVESLGRHLSAAHGG